MNAVPLIAAVLFAAPPSGGSQDIRKKLAAPPPTEAVVKVLSATSRLIDQAETVEISLVVMRLTRDGKAGLKARSEVRTLGAEDARRVKALVSRLVLGPQPEIPRP